MGCRSRRSQGELIRIVRSADQLAVGRALAGRGAWLCAVSPVDCLDLAVRRKAFVRALGTGLGVDATDRLRGYLAERARLSRCTPEGTTRGLTCNTRDMP